MHDYKWIRSKLKESPVFFDLLFKSSLGGMLTKSPFTFHPLAASKSENAFPPASKFIIPERNSTDRDW